MKKIVLIFSLLALSLNSALADESLFCPSEQRLTVAAIQIVGNARTDNHVIGRELDFVAGDTVCESRIRGGIDRIQLTSLFSAVSYTLKKTEDTSAVALQINVTEKWTTIPILKGNSGGGIAQYTLGIYDPNIFGEYLEAGAQYENLGGANSGVAWFKNPRLFGARQGIDLQYWNTKRIRVNYDQKSNEPQVERGFLLERERIFIEYSREVARETTGRLSLEYNRDTFSSKLLPKTVLDKIGSSPLLPAAADFFIARAGLDFGQVRGDPHTLSGQVLGLYASYAHALKTKSDSYFQGDLSFVLYRRPLPRLQFAQRVLAGVSSGALIQYQYSLGGLDRIRGFSDNRFQGGQFGLSNSELRYLLLERSFTLVQGVGFFDFVGIGDQASESLKLRAASLGVGVRLIFPRLYRFVVRLDFAKPVVKNDEMNWSFGVQQFF